MMWARMIALCMLIGLLLLLSHEGDCFLALNPSLIHNSCHQYHHYHHYHHHVSSKNNNMMHEQRYKKDTRSFKMMSAFNSYGSRAKTGHFIKNDDDASILSTNTDSNDNDAVESSSSYRPNSYQSSTSTSTSNYPPRTDIFNVLVTGHIGTDPKEVYLRNNSYVINFSLGVMNHLPTSTKASSTSMNNAPQVLWINAEIWGDTAKGAMLAGQLKKGNVIGAVGHLISNNYIDKMTGEEKKFYKVKISKIIDDAAVLSLSQAIKDI